MVPGQNPYGQYQPFQAGQFSHPPPSMPNSTNVNSLPFQNQNNYSNAMENMQLHPNTDLKIENQPIQTHSPQNNINQLNFPPSSDPIPMQNYAKDLNSQYEKVEFLEKKIRGNETKLEECEKVFASWEESFRNHPDKIMYNYYIEEWQKLRSSFINGNENDKKQLEALKMEINNQEKNKMVNQQVYNQYPNFVASHGTLPLQKPPMGMMPNNLGSIPPPGVIPSNQNLTPQKNNFPPLSMPPPNFQNNPQSQVNKFSEQSYEQGTNSFNPESFNDMQKPPKVMNFNPQNSNDPKLNIMNDSMNTFYQHPSKQNPPFKANIHPNAYNKQQEFNNFQNSFQQPQPGNQFQGNYMHKNHEFQPNEIQDQSKMPPNQSFQPNKFNSTVSNPNQNSFSRFDMSPHLNMPQNHPQPEFFGTY
ncbi:MAG: hypothetical protein MHPSP_002067 [Paramarteilia canceri]